MAFPIIISKKPRRLTSFLFGILLVCLTGAGGKLRTFVHHAGRTKQRSSGDAWYCQDVFSSLYPTQIHIISRRLCSRCCGTENVCLFCFGCWCCPCCCFCCHCPCYSCPCPCYCCPCCCPCSCWCSCSCCPYCCPCCCLAPAALCVVLFLVAAAVDVIATYVVFLHRLWLLSF